MKLITRDTDYAIRALCCIAGSEKTELSVRDLTDKLAMQRPFLRKILQELNKKGLLKSYKGRGGGFTLTVKPERVTVFDLVEIFQGPFQLSEHLFKGKTCPFIRTCYLKKKIDDMERNVIREMKSVTIASLLKSGHNFDLKKKS
ncbi:MAG: Rrf2 family transcriptional regulator [Candidatus Omnitrophota bacterium]